MFRLEEHLGMHSASRTGSIAELEQLRRAGLAVDAVDDCGRTCLQAAAAAGEESVVQWLLERGASVHATNPYTGRTALHASCAAGQGEISLLLLHAGAATTRRDHQGKTPAQLGAAAGHLDLVRILFYSEFYPDTASALKAAALGWNKRD